MRRLRKSLIGSRWQWQWEEGRQERERERGNVRGFRKEKERGKKKGQRGLSKDIKNEKQIDREYLKPDSVHVR